MTTSGTQVRSALPFEQAHTIRLRSWRTTSPPAITRAAFFQGTRYSPRMGVMLPPDQACGHSEHQFPASDPTCYSSGQPFHCFTVSLFRPLPPSDKVTVTFPETRGDTSYRRAEGIYRGSANKHDCSLRLIPLHPRYPTLFFICWFTSYTIRLF